MFGQHQRKRSRPPLFHQLASPLWEIRNETVQLVWAADQDRNCLGHGTSLGSIDFLQGGWRMRITAQAVQRVGRESDQSANADHFTSQMDGIRVGG